MQTRQASCMVVIREHARGPDAQCKKEATHQTEIQGFPVCGDHVLVSQTDILTFDLGISRLTLPVLTRIIDR